MDSATRKRRPCFLDINDGVAKAETEIGKGFSAKSLISRRTSFKNLPFDSSTSSQTRFQQQPHFLDYCFLCNRPLAHNRDIFMYRGDIPFCSEECRQEQIDMDEANDKKINLSASINALRIQDHINSNTTQEFHLHRDRVVAA